MLTDIGHVVLAVDRLDVHAPRRRRVERVTLKRSLGGAPGLSVTDA